MSTISKLVIVESPAKVKTIGKILGPDYVVKASMGHVRDLPERAFGVDIEHGFQPQYEENRNRGRNLSELKTAARSASEIYLASDPDREGEAIAWHLKELLKKTNSKAPFLRVTFNQITRAAIEKAFQNPGEINMALVNSQQARRVLDRIVGYQVSPLLWTRIERGVSAGRVQSVALRLVCEREREIQAFVPQEYWNFIAGFSVRSNAASGEKNFLAKLVKFDGGKVEISNGEDAGALLEKIRAVPTWTVRGTNVTPRRKFAQAPFITSTLQQAAGSSLGFSASQTMRVAQQLYEGVDVGGVPTGLITYMRTDSVAVAPEAQNACRKFISALYGPEYVPGTPNVYKSKSNAQEAHEAIRPTDISLTPEKLKNALDPQQIRLYTLIWRRFIASQMAPARLERTTAEIGGENDGHSFLFRSGATVIPFQGFLRVYNIASDENSHEDPEEDSRNAAVLATLKEKEECFLSDPDAQQKFTEPAPRFSEAALIKELETNGIGRPSTYATIVYTIQARKYVDKEKGKLIPTDLGFRINDYLVGSLPELFQVGFTASMEDQLDSIEDEKIGWTEMIGAFYSKFQSWLHSAKTAGAPASAKADALFEQMHRIQHWEIPSHAVGKQAFDDRKFFASIENKYRKDGLISGRQWKALLTLALKYEKDLPDLRETAEKNAFGDDLAEADKIYKLAEQARGERRAKQFDSAPAPEVANRIFDAMKDIHWAEPEKRRGRSFDDHHFFESLRKQSNAGKPLSEKQTAALKKLAEKYRTEIPDADNIIALLPGIQNTPAGDSEDAGEKAAEATALLAKFDRVTKWIDPVRKGRRVYDDHEFVQSIAKQMKAGKILSEKQLNALKKLAVKYSL